jgi:hypothetical protein
LTKTKVCFILKVYLTDWFIEYSSDVSESTLEGASRTVGGTIRGRAIGNVYSHADGSEILHQGLKQPKGKVLIYHDPSQAQPSMTFKTDVGPRLAPIIKSFSRKYSPVSSK